MSWIFGRTRSPSKSKDAAALQNSPDEARKSKKVPRPMSKKSPTPDATVKTILASEVMKEVFYGQLSQEHGNESLDFLNAVTKWKSKFKSYTPEQIKLVAVEKIYAPFVSPTGKCSINISGPVRDAVTKAVMESEEPISSRVFDDAVDEITKMLENDATMRFKASGKFEAAQILDDVSHFL